MKPALGYRQPHYPKSWQALPNGEVIVKEIEQVLALWWPKFFGYHLLKIGALSGYIDSSGCTIKHQMNLVERKQNGDIIADVDDLPFLEHSIDVCLLSHALEFSLDPHHVVREASRVLIPNGYLVITGFNPFSLAGLNKFIPYRKHNTPWNERFFSAMRVKDWLHLMGYEILVDEKVIYSSLSGRLSQGKIVQVWQKLASDFLPNFGSIYVLVAKKRVHPLTPIKPKWKIRPKFNQVEVPSMNSSHKIN
ncbi:class I SAM-dependent methyltransferase [Colwellia hornerae]|uniref:Methyltransferase domain-containing protein n=1 Tax=Colwellia hornerae TaxID=89402 RepID=A0A5C6QRX6_9GAMM|nr:class I SAM-dependent methyltransferase [Colwellia hornerae]TWX57741.1 methyltransferase domain-containing protein [Colwellia hornerae]TWX62528.1 methyltransferase domain-containing protein [Colwellia hornerae]TWX71440.1 methyltransferase domain-containing protein [Colwellia hornerae]